MNDIGYQLRPNLSQAGTLVNRAKLQFVLFFTKFFPMSTGSTKSG